MILHELGIVAPALLLIGAALATTKTMYARPDRRTGRLGTAWIGGQLALLALVTFLVVTLPEEPNSRTGGTCPDEDVFAAKLAYVLAWCVPLSGGPAVAAAFVQANRNLWGFRTLAVMVVALAPSYIGVIVSIWPAFCGLS